MDPDQLREVQCPTRAVGLGQAAAAHGDAGLGPALVYGVGFSLDGGTMLLSRM